jgi:hypothetical protein
MLARTYGAAEDPAREAAILHDITKALDLDDQLQLCRKYDIMTDIVSRRKPSCCIQRPALPLRGTCSARPMKSTAPFSGIRRGAKTDASGKNHVHC